MDYTLWILCIATFVINMKYNSKGYQISHFDHYIDSNTVGKYLSSCHKVFTLHPEIPLTIQSPNFPYPYPPKSFCVWKFQAPFIGKVVVTFTNFLMQTGTSAFTCNRDFLDITDWTGSTRFCSLGPPSHVINISSTWMEITFVSDESWEYSGFKATIQFIPSLCGGHLLSTSGIFESPNYPFSHPTNIICGWVIEVPCSFRIRLDCKGLFHLSNFSRSCHGGFLSISKTGDIQMKDAQIFCGTDGPGVVYGVNNRLVAIFHSNNLHSGIGFRCRYKAVPKQDSNSDRNDLTSCNCGKTSPRSPRIIGGSPSTTSEYPWIIFITDNKGKYLCNGVLVRRKFVLTAGHCIYGRLTNHIRLLVRVDDINRAVDLRQPLAVEEILIYPGYKRHYQDLALLRIKITGSHRRAIKSICLPPLDAIFENQTATVIGWNHEESGNDIKYQLHEVAVPVLSSSICQKSYGNQTFDSDQMICAGSPGRDACEGDSGGPLMFNSNGTWLVIGIVSFGLGCGLPGFPGVYVRVTHYLAWLNEKTGDKECY